MGKKNDNAGAGGQGNAGAQGVTRVVAKEDVGDYIQSRIDNESATNIQATQRADGDFDVTSDV